MLTKKFKFILILLVALFSLLLVLLSPVYTVSDVTVTGNKRVTTANILKDAGLNKPVNLFAFSSRGAKKQLLLNNYIESVDIKKDFMDCTITLTVKERVLSGYVEYLAGSYIYIDENGRVLEVAPILEEKLPIVVGLDFSTFTEGKILDVTNKKSFNTLVTLAHLFKKYEMEASVIRVNLQDENNPRLLVDNLDIELGDIKDADEKIRTIKVILQTPELQDVKGFLDIKDINRPPRFKFLT